MLLIPQFAASLTEKRRDAVRGVVVVKVVFIGRGSFEVHRVIVR